MKHGFFSALTVALVSGGLAQAEPSLLVKMALTGPLPPATEMHVTADAPPGDMPKVPEAAPAPAAPSTVLDHADACGNDCCPKCCEKPQRYWVSGENLFWWVKHGPLASPLVSTGSPASLGVLGNPGASVLFGNTGLNYGELEGFRVGAGGWLNCANTVGVEASFFLLEQGTTGFTARSDATGTPVLTIPIVNAQTGTPAGVAVSLPGAFAGAVGVKSTSRLFGTEANGVYNWMRTCNWSLDGLAGFRYMDLEETLGVTRTATTLAGGNRFFLGTNIPGASTANFADEFDTRDQFFGGQLGARFEYHWNKVTAELTGRVALGGNFALMNNHGDSTLIQAGLPNVTVPGGLLAGPSNSGRFHDTHLSYVPEVGAHVGYAVTRNISLFAGYTWLYWDELARPGNQIDRSVNLTQFSLSPTFGPLNGPARPALTNQRSDFWAQGVDVGVAFSF